MSEPRKITLQEVEAVMIFRSGWTKAEIEGLTYRELFEMVELYNKIENDRLFEILKLFCVFNAESSAVAFSTKEDAVRNYAEDVRKRRMDSKEELDLDSDIDFQFQGLFNG